VPSSDKRQRTRKLRDRAREMRANPTPAERRLWSMLRDQRMPEVKFRRQHVIAPYIVDFACIEQRLIIEADGGQHAESDSDRQRDAYLGRLGFRVLRFWNSDVLENASGVFEMICAALHTPLTLPLLRSGPLPLPMRGEGLHGSADSNV